MGNAACWRMPWRPAGQRQRARRGVRLPRRRPPVPQNPLGLITSNGIQLVVGSR